MRDILVHISRYPTWTGGVEYAAHLAAALDASLTGAYVYPSPLYMMPPYGSPELLSAMIENAQSMEEGALRVREAFAAWAAERGVARTNWQVAEGYLPDTLGQICNWHDLLVVERDPELLWGAPQALATLMLQVGVPCIVVPGEGRFTAAPSRIALAWNGAPEAARAIHAAIPLLRGAKAVFLLCGDRRDLYSGAGFKPPFSMTEHLARHGIDVQRRIVDAADDEAGTALLETCADCEADLLVMGAYGRSRFSEWAFGGATRQVLAQAPIPVLMRH